MKKEVQLIKKSNNKLCLIPIDVFYENKNILDEQKVCNIITQDIFGWWIYENAIDGGAYDGIGECVIVRDITDVDVETILNKGGKCFVKVDYKNELKIPRNGRSDGKIVIYLNNNENQ